MTESIDVRVEGPLATISLDRPQVRNAFNASMISELTDAFLALRDRDHVRVIVLRGNGRTFSAGADVEWMRASLEFTREDNEADALAMSDMFAAIDGSPQVVLGRVHGAALGGGMGLMAVCDIVVAARDAVFGFTETRLGIIPAVISRFVLPKIGESWARALYLSGERFDADTARQIGLAHWVVDEESLDSCVGEKIESILSSGPFAVREAKAFIATARGMGDAEMRSRAADLIARLRTSPEGQEGLRAFLEKRHPGWLMKSTD